MQIKTIVGNGFGEILQEVQEAIQEGWEIDFTPATYPQANFTYYEVILKKAVAEETTDGPAVEPKKAGRPVTKK